ncbi:MAG: BREX-1 system adenine-specific DNA-methyltransferase PglX, partial [Acinetobacter sp.]
DRRIFGRGIHLNICAFQNSDDLNAEQLWQALNLNKAWQAGSHVDMFGQAQADLGAEETDPRYTLIQDLVVKFKDAKAFGSLISVDNSHEASLFDLKNTLSDLIINGDSLQKASAEKFLPIVEQAWILSQRYDAVIANPPYMGGGGMNANLKAFAKKYFPDSKSDLFAMFIEHGFSLLGENAFNAMVTMQSWMFLSSYQELRNKLLTYRSIQTLMQIGYNSFPELNSKVVQCCAFIISKNSIENYTGTYIDLNSYSQSFDKKKAFLKKEKQNYFFKKQKSFKKISSSPIAYWLTESLSELFTEIKLSDAGVAKQGLATADNNRFVRNWAEVSIFNIGFNISSERESQESSKKWFPYNKGGDKRKWYGNHSEVVNWENLGNEIVNFIDENGKQRSRPQNREFYFKESISWGLITSAGTSFRYFPQGFIYDVGGMSFFPKVNYKIILGLLNLEAYAKLINAINPSLNLQLGDVINLPFDPNFKDEKFIANVSSLIELTVNDWNAYESSWNFKRVPLLANEYRQPQIEQNYSVLREVWQNKTLEVQSLERENNKVFIEAYGLADELTPEVPLKEITLTCNPHYRYGGDATEEQLEQRLQSDTIAELISYAIGCMMGRYSLDRVGLVYAHEGNVGFNQLVAEGAYKTFPADDDGILPLLDEERFPDGVYSRFEQFIATAWDKETLQQNLDFIAESLRLYNVNPKNGESSAETIRRYLSNHFYKDQHLKIYKSRPIYWLFSSGKQKAFECLVYMHRFNDATLAKMRTQYVLPLMGQLTARAQFLSDADKDTSLSPAEKTKYAKEADNLHKKLNELKDFDAELKHHIEQKISIDLDDGVKVNYGKFAKLLAEAKKVTGNKE